MKCLIAILGLLLAAAALADEPASNAPPAKSKDHGPKIVISTDRLMEKREERHKDVPSGAPLIVATVFSTPVLIVALVLIYRYRKNAMLHRTLAAMIDKGVPIPPELLQPDKPRKNDLRRGITLIAVGVGLIGFFAFTEHKAVGIGFIPLLIGVGYLIVWKLEQKKQNGQNPS